MKLSKKTIVLGCAVCTIVVAAGFMMLRSQSTSSKLTEISAADSVQQTGDGTSQKTSFETMPDASSSEQQSSEKDYGLAQKEAIKNASIEMTSVYQNKNQKEIEKILNDSTTAGDASSKKDAATVSKMFQEYLVKRQESHKKDNETKIDLTDAQRKSLLTSVENLQKAVDASLKKVKQDRSTDLIVDANKMMTSNLEAYTTTMRMRQFTSTMNVREPIYDKQLNAYNCIVDFVDKNGNAFATAEYTYSETTHSFVLNSYELTPTGEAFMRQHKSSDLWS